MKLTHTYTLIMNRISICRNGSESGENKNKETNEIKEFQSGIYCSDKIQNLEKWIECILCTVSKSYIHFKFPYIC